MAAAPEVFEACLALIGLVVLIALAFQGFAELLAPTVYEDEVIEGIYATTAEAEAAMYAVADQRPERGWSTCAPNCPLEKPSATSSARSSSTPKRD